MTFKQFIKLMIIATISLWIGWWWVILSVNPFITDGLGFLLFYGVLSLALLGTFTLAGVYMRKMRLEHDLIFHIVLLAFRQAIMLTTFFIVLLLLQSQRLLFWWNISVLFLIIFLIEVFMLKKERKSFPPTVSLDPITY